MSFEYRDGHEWVSPEASGRRGGYWRKIPCTRSNPTLAQARHRLVFSKAAANTRGLYGTVPTPDGRQVSRSAVALGDMLQSPKETTTKKTSNQNQSAGTGSIFLKPKSPEYRPKRWIDDMIESIQILRAVESNQIPRDLGILLLLKKMKMF